MIFFTETAPQPVASNTSLVYFCKWNFAELRWTVPSASYICDVLHILQSINTRLTLFILINSSISGSKSVQLVWNVDTVYSSQIYSYRFQIHEKAALGIFFQKDLIFLELVIPLRYPHLQGTYAFSWLWYQLCSARCFAAKFHSA